MPDQDPLDATLIFHEQADGRKVARLHGGKVVLIDLKSAERVRDGEAWYVRLRHNETFAIAEPVEKVTRATWESTQALSSPMADALARARQITIASQSPPAPGPPAVAGTRPEPAVQAAPPAPVDISRIIRPGDRVAFFIDGANTDGASRSAGYFIDFVRAREFFLGAGSYYAGFYYVADFAQADGLQQSFFDFLSHAGYIVRRRRVKVIVDEDTGERIYKGNLDTEIVLDMLNTVDNFDVAFLFSGDSDFERAVDLLRARGKRLYVVTARRQISRELAYIADKPIVYLEDHRAVLARTDRDGSRSGGVRPVPGG